MPLHCHLYNGDNSTHFVVLNVCKLLSKHMVPIAISAVIYFVAQTEPGLSQYSLPSKRNFLKILFIHFPSKSHPPQIDYYVSLSLLVLRSSLILLPKSHSPVCDLHSYLAEQF